MDFFRRLFFFTPDRILAWLASFGVFLLWFQGYSGIDGISATIILLTKTILEKHWNSILFIKGDTMPHLISSILYWLFLVLIIWFFIVLIRKVRGENKIYDTDSIKKLTTEIEKLNTYNRQTNLAIKLDKLIGLISNQHDKNNYSRNRRR